MTADSRTAGNAFSARRDRTTVTNPPGISCPSSLSNAAQMVSVFVPRSTLLSMKATVPGDL